MTFGDEPADLLDETRDGIGGFGIALDE